MMKTVSQGTNAMGEFTLLPLDKELYCRESIMKTCYAFTDDYYIHVIKLQEGTVGITFYQKHEDIKGQDFAPIVKDFLQLLHENQMRQIILKETSNLHEQIVRKAFAPATSLMGQSQQDDSLHILTSRV